MLFASRDDIKLQVHAAESTPMDIDDIRSIVSVKIQ